MGEKGLFPKKPFLVKLYLAKMSELFLLWSFHIFFLSPFLWPLLWSLPICPVYLDFICYQSHKSSPLCAPRDKKHIFLFSCWISCPAPHRKSTRRCWKRFWNKQIKRYLHGNIPPRALGHQSEGLDASVSNAICGVCSFRQQRVSIRVLFYKMLSFIFSAIPYVLQIERLKVKAVVYAHLKHHNYFSWSVLFAIQTF